MKRRWIIGLPTLLTVIALGLGVLAIVRRHRTEWRLAELEKTDRAIQAAIFSSTIPPAPSSHPEENPRRLTVVSKSESKETRHPDLNKIFAAHPELETAYQKATVGKLHQTYDRLWGRLGLSSGQIEQAVSIMMRDDENEMDLAMTAEALKLPANDPALRQFRHEEMAATQSALESALGPQGYEALRDYNRVLTMRTSAEDVASLTAASDSPMTGAQTEQLTQVLAEANGSYRNGGRPNWISTDWDDVLDKASTFLTPPQLSALKTKAQQARAAAMLAQFYSSRTPR
jgi:hypothetical protein